MNIFSQDRTTDREPVVAGSFYSADKESLAKDLSQMFATCKKPMEEWSVRAIISPHAGYVFSGETAASAFSAIPRNAVYKNIFLIGSSHVMAFEGASVYNVGDFISPLGKIRVNREIADKLKNSDPLFRFPVTAHAQEHSLEVQVPFIQSYFKQIPQIIPIIIGTTKKESIKKIAGALKPWFNEENLFIISSDFSHYPDYSDALDVDNLTAEAIVSKDPETFLRRLESNSSRSVPGLATSMCGWTSGLTLLYLAGDDQELEFKRISYSNSGDSKYGDKYRVVGYNAIALVVKKDSKSQQKEESSVSFSRAERELLFSIVRNSISNGLNENKKLTVDSSSVPENLKQNMGAFVTLKIDGNLRGCIGRLFSTEPLYDVVNQMAWSSAFEDYRFSPLTKEEFKKAEIEISVLGPLKKVNNISEIVLGKHGIYIKKDFRSGTMLPQVATENNWTLEQFLGYTSRDKAGIGWDGWKNAEVFVYEAVVLEEIKK